ncbi:MAG: hypothetical protein IJH67_09065 [Thermoguttaceae bacterium]|nr:hypothetical protein [Thermoguttaceae bacterium]
MFKTIKNLISHIPFISRIQKKLWEYEYFKNYYIENKRFIELSAQQVNYRYKANLPVMRLTNSPLYHWGAYFDQIHFDPTNRYVVANEVDFQHRTPEPDDRINVGLIDTQDNFRWIPIGSTVAWNWQQGCMLQWIPGNASDVVWNDRVDGRFISHIYNLKTKTVRDLPFPVYGLAPNGEFAIFPDFARLGDTRPGYGYCGIPDENHDVLAPENSGIWKMNLQTGECQMLFSVYDISQIEPLRPYSHNAKHWFNHIIISPDSKRFVFLHRWRGEEEGAGWKTRMITANTSDGKDISIINPNEMTSHNVWRDCNHLIAFARYPSNGDSVYLIDAKTGAQQQLAENQITQDTHVSFVPETNGEWILNDSYPNEFRFQSLFLYHLPSQTRVDLGEFYSPEEYAGEWRCDLHPRCSRDGKKVIFDSAHEGLGRQIYMVDISDIINAK